MVTLESPKYPHLRVHLHTIETSVKFRDGVAEVAESVAEEMLALEGLELRVADITEDDEAGADSDEEDADEPDESDEGADGVAEVAPVKRKPGRPRKADQAE